MYCGHCGSILKENSRYCGKCGTAVPLRTPDRMVQVVYIEEQPLTPIFGDKVILALTFGILGLSILTIFVSSVITKDIPSSSHLQGEYEDCRIL